MKLRRRLLALIALAVLAIVIANGQTPRAAISHHEKGDISFDYPAEWKLIDRSNGDVQYIAVGPEGGAAQIAVIARFGNDILNSSTGAEYSVAKNGGSEIGTRRETIKRA